MLDLPAPPVLLVNLLIAELVAADLPSTRIEEVDSRLHLLDLDESHRLTATAVLDAHPTTAQARLDEGATLRANQATVRDRADQALATNATFLALASPTNAQNAAQIKALTRQANGLIRLALNRFDSAD